MAVEIIAERRFEVWKFRDREALRVIAPRPKFRGTPVRDFSARGATGPSPLATPLFHGRRPQDNEHNYGELFVLEITQ